MIELTISETVLFLIPGTKSLCLKFVNNSECNPPQFRYINNYTGDSCQMLRKK